LEIPHLIAADVAPYMRLMVFTPCWSRSPAGTGFISPECSAWLSDMDVTDPKHSDLEVNEAITHIVNNHQDCDFATYHRLINELPPLVRMEAVA